MKQNQLNDHDQPFSKKQKKASRVMMANRRGFQPRESGTMPNLERIGLLDSIASMMFGFKVRRKAS